LRKVSDIEQLKRCPKGTPNGSESVTSVESLLIRAGKRIDTLRHLSDQHRRPGEQLEVIDG
jgi:hypothetical protein